MENLGNFFSLVGEEKKKEKEKTKEIVGEVSLGDLFASLSEEKKKVKEKSLEKEKELEKIKKDAKIFEAFLFSEAPKVEKDTQKEVKVLEKGLLNLKNTSYKSIDRLMRGICKKYDITPLELHNQFKEKHGVIPDDWVKQQKEDIDVSNWKDDYKPYEIETTNIIEPERLRPSPKLESIKEEKESLDESVTINGDFNGTLNVNIEDLGIEELKRLTKIKDISKTDKSVPKERNETIDKSLEILDQLVTEEEKINESETEIARLKREMDQLRKMVNEVTRVASTQGGGGEVRLEFLDDVDRDSVKVDGKALVWDSSAGTLGKFVGSNYIDVAGYAHTAGISTVSQGLTGTPDVVVGVLTGSSAFFSGNVTIGGTITYEDVKNVDSVGLITARTGIDVLSGGINAVGISTISTGIGTVHIGVGRTALLVDGNARITGILTVGTASITLDPNERKITGLKVVDGGINVSGVITASSFSGDGSELANVISGVGIQSGSVRVGTGFTDVNFTGADLTVVGSGTTITVNIPPIPTNNNQLSNGAGYITGVSTFSGNYNNLTNKPTIPTNNNQLSNGAGFITTSFTNTSQLTNDAGFITTSFTNTSQLTNDAGFITTSFTSYNQLSDTPTNLSQFSNDVGFVTFTNNNQLSNGASYITTSFTNTSQLTNDAGFITGVSTFSGNYNDLSNKPTIPTNNNELTNGAGYITNNVSGALTATSFSGDGSGLTNVGMDTSNVSANTLIVSGIATFSSNVTIGGTLTYEDVTNIDSVGLITARSGVRVAGGGLSVIGVSTLGIITGATYYGDGSNLIGVANTSNVIADTLVVTGVSTVGVVTGATSIQATTYYGDGSKLTGINAGAGGTENVSSNTIQSGIITATEQFYPPSLTTVERDGLSFNVGAFIFNETENKLQMYLGSQWKNLAFELDSYSVVGL